MKLLLIRHAAAVPRGTPGVLDAERPLTPQGKAKFRVAARGLARVTRRPDVLLTLQDARRDPNPDVRQAARAALARLGERQALQWFRQTLTSEDPQRVHDTIQTIAVEGLTLLWPDLDRLADAEDPDVAHHAREALERLSEEMERNSNSR